MAHIKKLLKLSKNEGHIVGSRGSVMLEILMTRSRMMPEVRIAQNTELGARGLKECK